MFFIFRSIPKNSDARVARNASLLQKCEYSTKEWTWEKKAESEENFPFSKSGNRYIRLIKYIIFLFWVPYVLIKARSSYSGVIFMDLETALLGLPCAKLLRKYVVFDVVDPFSQTKLNYKLVDYLEYHYINQSHLSFFPSESRVKYYLDRLGKKINNDYLVVENVPDFPIRSEKNKKKDRNDKIIIGYFGTLDRDSRGLESLVSIAEKDTRLSLMIGGTGALYDFFYGYEGEADIDFVGSFQHADLLMYFSKIDFSWAYYSPAIELHRYAAPNKFYEHLYFSTPLIISSIIPQAEFVRENRTGVIVYDLRNLDLYEECEQYLVCDIFSDKDLWSENYNNYYNLKAEELRSLMLSKSMIKK